MLLICCHIMIVRQEAVYRATGNAREAFTLVEIMIVVAVIGLLAALVIPSFDKARKQSQGRRVLNDARQMDAAISQWAMETYQSDGATIDTVQSATYLKVAWASKDILGNSFKVATVGTNQITIARRTKNRLAGVGIDWVRTDRAIGPISSNVARPVRSEFLHPDWKPRGEMNADQKPCA
jgi:prepilin-type N-terminal cleavage/methylation domain-containing protein